MRLLEFDVLRGDLLVRLNGHQLVVFAFRGGFATVDFQPAGFDQDLALALKRFAFDPRDARGDEKLRGRVKNGQKAPHHHVVNFLLCLGEALGGGARRDDREVVTHLRIVEDALVGLHPVLRQDRCGEGGVSRAVHRAERLLHRRDVVLRQRPRVGARIGKDLVLLVERLRDGQRVLGRKPKALVGIALEAGQIEEQRRKGRAGLAFLGDGAGLAEALGADGFGLCLVPQSLGPERFVSFLPVRGLGERFIEPAPCVFTRRASERANQLPVSPRDKPANLLLAFDEDGQRGRLHATDGGLVEAAALGVEGGHHARAVDADQPIGLAAASGGVGQRKHLGVAAQAGEAVPDGGGRHRLEPESLDRLPGVGVADDVAKDQFPLAPGVAGVDERGHVLPLGEFGQDFEPLLIPLNRLQVEVRRDDRKIGKGPLAFLGLVLLRANDLEQMPHGRREDELVVLEIILVP